MLLGHWIRHGTIYGKGQDADRATRLGRIEGWPDDQTIDDIATDTVVAALIYFRRQGAHDPSLAILGRGVAGHLLSSASASISSPTSTAAHCAPNCPPTGSFRCPLAHNQLHLARKQLGETAVTSRACLLNGGSR